VSSGLGVDEAESEVSLESEAVVRPPLAKSLGCGAYAIASVSVLRRGVIQRLATDYGDEEHHLCSGFYPFGSD
jgi:hypothetical protein